MKYPKVSVIIINYNKKEYLRDCINSVKKNTKYPNYDITVVDNCSKDGSVEMVKKEFPKVKIIENEKNYAFGWGSNIAIKQTKGKYVTLLDNDTIVQKKWLSKMVETAEKDEKIAIAASIVVLKSLYDYHKKGSNLTDDEITKIVMKNYLKRHSSLKRVEELSHVAITACLLRRDIFNRIGFFSDYMFLFWEDTELCWRAILAGYKVVYDFDSVVYHYVGTTRKKNNTWLYERIKNKIYTYIELLDWKHSINYTSIALIKNVIGVVKDPRTLKARSNAVYTTVKSIKKIIKDRNDFKEKKVINSEKLIKLIEKTYNFEKINADYERSLPRNMKN